VYLQLSEKEKYQATVNVKRATRDRFKRLCLKIETYDKFLNRLLDLLEKQEKA
jgi:hypothetical protein